MQLAVLMRHAYVRITCIQHSDHRQAFVIYCKRRINSWNGNAVCRKKRVNDLCTLASSPRETIHFCRWLNFRNTSSTQTPIRLNVGANCINPAMCSQWHNTIKRIRSFISCSHVGCAITAAQSTWWWFGKLGSYKISRHVMSGVRAILRI